MSLFGALGLTFIVIGLIAGGVQFLYDKSNKINRFTVAFFAGLLVIGIFAGDVNIKKSEVSSNGINVRIVQPVTTQANKIALSRVDALNQAKSRVDDLAELAGNLDNIDLVVYPETAYPFFLRKDSDVMPIASKIHKPVIIGANSYADGRVYNSFVMSDADGNVIDIYDKSHLVPFGEYGPIKFVPVPSHLTAGGGARVMSLRIDNNKTLIFAPAVCYEIIFSDAVVKNDYVNAIINITNDTWFGNTPGTYQHLDMVRRAAIESGVPVIRANYSGISAFVAADGRVISSLPIGHIGVLDGDLCGSHMTLYRLLGRDVWFIIILFVAFLGGFIAYRLDKND